MTLFQTVKEAVSTRQAAGRYGVQVGKGGMACCPFHPDKTPSMKVDSRFHCFGCGADGDVIAFTAKLFGLRPVEAARKLAADFAVPFSEKERGQPRRFSAKKRETPRVSPEERYRLAEARCFRTLCRYFHLLEDWEREFAPKNPDEPLHPRFLEAVQKKDAVSHWLEVLQCGSVAEKAPLVADCVKEVVHLERKFPQLAGGDPAMDWGSH